MYSNVLKPTYINISVVKECACIHVYERVCKLILGLLQNRVPPRPVVYIRLRHEHRNLAKHVVIIHHSGQVHLMIAWKQTTAQPKKNINLNQTSALDKLIRLNALYNQISKLTVAFLFLLEKKPGHQPMMQLKARWWARRCPLAMLTDCPARN